MRYPPVHVFSKRLLVLVFPLLIQFGCEFTFPGDFYNRALGPGIKDKRGDGRGGVGEGL